jgi:uncharacterized protein (DUF302 family)
MNFTNSRLSLAVLLLSFALLIGAGVVMARETPVLAGERAMQQLPADAEHGGYYLSTAVDTDYETTLGNVRAALAEEGFGILWETDLRDKFAEKLAVQIPPYRILGACNPTLANAVYQQEGWIGTLMPCNVVVRELEDGSVAVAIQNPLMLPQATGNPDVQPAAGELAAAASRVLGRL